MFILTIESYISEDLTYTTKVPLTFVLKELGIMNRSSSKCGYIIGDINVLRY